MVMANNDQWHPFRPSASDLQRIAGDVADIADIQMKTSETNEDLRSPDRVAHEYQIAGSKVTFNVAHMLPEPLQGVGLFQPGAKHVGIGRISTGLSIPHAENLPDFLGIMTTFRTEEGVRVDFLGINDPTAPTDNHRDFMTLLQAAADSAGKPGFAEQQVALAASLEFRMPFRAVGVIAHITRQTLPTASSSTAFQRYWTGIVEVGGIGGKFTFLPDTDENEIALLPNGRRFTEEWRARQGAGPIKFNLHWIPFLDEERTPTLLLTRPWQEDHKQLVGSIEFPQIDVDSDESMLWATLASEMGANPGNWIADAANSIPEPSTEFMVARKIAYQKSQQGRDALPPDAYQSIFSGAPISPELARELRRRRQTKGDTGHVNRAP
jgi:hypothetical protein